MTTMKLNVAEAVPSYHGRLEQWITKELQLNVLHEEIINKREALLRTSSNLLHKTARQEPLFNHTDATIRNEKLLKDLQSLETFLSESQQEPVSSSFAYLQANYKSMVENMFPIWQKSLEEIQAAETTSVNINK
ncbi:hypothetical protein BsWGS_05453 [Bradybaena similaris]